MHAVADSVTMVRRDLLHLRRDPSPAVLVVAVPVLVLLVFGPTLVPGILVMTAAGAGYLIAGSVAADLSGGVAARFRTMAIRRSSLLVGHVVGGAVRASLGFAAVLAVGFAVGFRPDATPVAWTAAAGLLMLSTVAFAGLWAALGRAGTLVLLPFLGSGLVYTEPTLRGLLLGTPIGVDGAVAAGWCVAVSLGSLLWARRLHARRPAG